MLEWADKSANLLVARGRESPQQVLGVLHANLFFQPNVGHGFIIEDLFVRRELSIEQKRSATVALFTEFHKVCFLLLPDSIMKMDVIHLKECTAKLAELDT